MDRLCRIRDLQRGIIAFEQCFEKSYGISLNEGMLLCSLKTKGRLSCGELSNLLGLTQSNTSKVIASAERKGLVIRSMGQEDKRQMYFTLTEEGISLISSVSCNDIEIPDIIRQVLP